MAILNKSFLMLSIFGFSWSMVEAIFSNSNKGGQEMSGVRWVEDGWNWDLCIDILYLRPSLC